MKHLLIILTFLTGYNSLVGQTSEKAAYSVLTCERGNDLYNLYGHTALRIVDPETNVDWIFNWGMFDFGEDPTEFGFKFIQGKLDYFIAVEDIENFLAQYHFEGRSVYEQTLNLTVAQKENIWSAIQTNLKPENKTYKYDFFLDNCTTRVLHLIRNALGKEVNWAKLKEHKEYTFRQLLYHQSQSKPWIALAMNLALGSSVDQKADSDDMQFLPKYFQESLNAATINGAPLVASERTLFTGELKIEEPGWLTPETVLWTFFFVLLIVTLLKIKFLDYILTSLLFIVTSIAGFAVLWLWFTSDHQTMSNNFHLVWANPLNILALSWIFSEKLRKKLSGFFRVMTLAHLALVLFWIIIPQEFDSAFKAIMLAMNLKYYYWYTQNKPPKKDKGVLGIEL